VTRLVGGSSPLGHPNFSTKEREDKMLTIFFILIGVCVAVWIVDKDHSVRDLSGCSLVFIVVFLTFLITMGLNFFTIVLLTRGDINSNFYELMPIEGESRILKDETGSIFVKIETSEGKTIKNVDGVEFRNDIKEAKLENRIRFMNVIGPKYLLWKMGMGYQERSNENILLIPNSYIEVLNGENFDVVSD
jgi:hypothetical protein